MRRFVPVTTGDALSYDALLVAVGALPRPAVPGAIAFAGLGQAADVTAVVRRGRAGRRAPRGVRRARWRGVVPAGVRAGDHGGGRSAQSRRPRRRAHRRDARGAAAAALRAPTARPVDLAAEPLHDRTSAAAPAPDRDDAYELALLLAEEDARAGDFGHALHALDAAAALAGGVVPEEWAERRARWQRELTPFV